MPARSLVNVIRDWCLTTGADTSYIEPGSPWQNPFVESFGARVRDELRLYATEWGLRVRMRGGDGLTDGQSQPPAWRRIRSR